MPTLLWFRRDLRLTDLPALLDAAGGDAEVLACFVLDPRLTASSGPRRLAHLQAALHQLDAALGGRLHVAAGLPHQCIPVLATRVGATSVHISADYSPFGVRRDAAVRAALGPVPLVASGSPYLVAPGRVTKADGTPYRVFTPYFQAWLRHGWRRPADTGPDTARWIALPGGAAVPAAGPQPGTGESAALAQWREFVDGGLPGYARNRDRPDLDLSSRMSVHLKFGTIHPRTLAADLGAADQAYLRELAFRDFYAAVLHFWPASAWHNWNRAFDRIQVDDDAAARSAFERWKAGSTGFPIVDAGMRQLNQTGFMPNRVRMITASFLVKDLHLPWQWGARWFLEQLSDGDLASNQHGWQWCAGSGTDAAPYFRVFSPSAQAAKFDPAGDYVRRWVPELGGPDYPAPMVDHATERLEALRRFEALGRAAATDR